VSENRTYWSTDSEVRFVRYLGTGKWGKSHAVTKAGREQLLRRYQQSCLARTNWGDVEVGNVLREVDRCLMDFLPF
jgi:hypothetical protein